MVLKELDDTNILKIIYLIIIIPIKWALIAWLRKEVIVICRKYFEADEFVKYDRVKRPATDVCHVLSLRHWCRLLDWHRWCWQVVTGVGNFPHHRTLSRNYLHRWCRHCQDRTARPSVKDHRHSAGQKWTVGLNLNNHFFYYFDFVFFYMYRKMMLHQMWT